MKTELPEFPETLIAAVRFFSDADVSLAFMVSMRWPDGAISCPRCDSDKVTFLETRRIWKCRGCAKQFSVKVGTIIEDSPLGLDKWLPAVWSIVNAKNGVSSCELARSLGVTQKTGWFMLHRIRLAMQKGSFVKSKLTGTVEVDESYIGGLARNMHKSTKERRGITGTGGVGKTAIQGILQRGGKAHSTVIAEVVEHTRGTLLNANVRKHVLRGSKIHTDALPAYRDLQDDFAHKVVDHAEFYVKDGVHTNGLENFWSLLKRSLKGTYVSVEPFPSLSLSRRASVSLQ